MKTCVMVIVKDEQEYIQEFIEHHLNIGVDALFIFEDIGSRSHKHITDKYDNVYLLSILDVYYGDEKDRIRERKEKKMAVQSDYIQHAIKYIKTLGEYDWCFSLDADEYVQADGDIHEILSRFSDWECVIMYWKNYGANGHILKPQYTSIQETYTKECGFTNIDWNNKIITKMVLNLREIDTSFPIPCHFSPTRRCIRTDFSRQLSDPPCYDLLYIKHYITKSFEEYMWKLTKRGMLCKVHRKICDFFEMNKDMDKEECMRVLEEHQMSNTIIY